MVLWVENYCSCSAARINVVTLRETELLLKTRYLVFKDSSGLLMLYLVECLEQLGLYFVDLFAGKLEYALHILI